MCLIWGYKLSVLAMEILYRQINTIILYKTPRSVQLLAHWGRMAHICVGKQIIIVSDNGLLLARRQAIFSNNAQILLLGPLGTNFSEILIEIHTFSFHKMHVKMSSAKWRPCLCWCCHNSNFTLLPQTTYHRQNNSRCELSDNRICYNSLRRYGRCV